MEEQNELNDIILNKGANSNSNKKIILAVAALGVILIVVVMLMNSLTSSGTDNLPQAVLPPEPQMQAQAEQAQEEEALFEEVEVIQDETQNNANLDEIAQRLKQESQEEVQVEEPVVEEQVVEETPKAQAVPKEVKTAPKPVEEKKVQKPAPAKPSAQKPAYYVQVGSFSKYAPNEKFLNSITSKGYTYKYHKANSGSKTITKVLIGPFSSDKDARTALRKIRSSIEAGAFITKM